MLLRYIKGIEIPKTRFDEFISWHFRESVSAPPCLSTVMCKRDGVPTPFQRRCYGTLPVLEAVDAVRLKLVVHLPRRSCIS